jgi:hypothetical protein
MFILKVYIKVKKNIILNINKELGGWGGEKRKKLVNLYRKFKKFKFSYLYF